jgi:predicted Zn-dependent peptidase
MKSLRKPFRFVLASLFVLSFVGAAFPQAAATAPQITEFDVNGMKVLLKRRPGTPTVATGLFFRGGSQNLTPDTAGIENFTLKAATEAAKSYPRETLRKETSRLGTVITSGSNYDYSALSMISTREAFDTSWKMFVDVALNPTFLAADVDRVRDGILTNLRAENDSPEGSLEALTQKTVYAGHAYSNSPDGTIANVSKFKSADLAAYHRKLIQASRMLLVVVGDVEPEVLRQRITASFASVPRGDYKVGTAQAVSFTQPTVDVAPKGVQTDYVKGTFAAPPMGHPDYYAMRTAITLLQTAVYQEVRVKRNLSYAPDAELYGLASNTGAISVSSVNPNEAVKVMLGEIKKLREQPVDEDTLAQMGGFFLTTHYLKQETNAAQAGELAQYELIGGGWRNSLEFLDRMRKVKPTEVQAAANKYMRNLRFTVVGNPADVDKTIFLQN